MVSVAVLVSALAIWMYRSALDQVDALLARPLWAEQGQVTGELVVMPGLGVGSDVLAGGLQRAGYSRVQTPEEAGDFSADSRRVFVRDGDVDVLITFKDDVIATVSPQSPHRFKATELAGTGTSTERRLPISLSGLPEHVSLAVLAMEDARFFLHPGVDAWGILRALVVNIIGDGYRQGGSTLTQQLAKNLFLTPERSLKRKVKELALAVAIEERLKKEEILELYLNQVYLGSVGGVGVSGIQQAAQIYFGTSARRLSLGQAATLAGIISAPNRYSPLRHPERARERRDLVLKRMVDLGWVTPESREAAASTSIAVRMHTGHRRAPWAIDAAIETVEARLGEGTVSAGAMSVQTTLDTLLQEVAEAAVSDGLKALQGAHKGAVGTQAALVALDPKNGDILALVGGRSYAESGFNRAIHGSRQVGSTVKPLSWLSLMENQSAISPSTLVPDEPIERVANDEIWAPQNYDGEFLGEVTLEEALATSRNIPAVHVSEWQGLDVLAEFLGRLGLDGARPYPSTALGAFDASPVDVAAAYTVFPGLGKAVSPRLVKSVRLPDGQEGWSARVEKRRIASEQATFLTHTMMSATMQHGTGRGAARFGVDGVTGGKTGTTDGGRDAWFVGYTPRLVVAVWVGFDKGKSLGLTGAQAALPIWARFVAASGREDSAGMSPPDSVVEVPICTVSGEPAAEACPDSVPAWFAENTDEEGLCGLHDDGMFSGTRSIIEQLRQKLQPAEGDGASKDDKKVRRGFWRRRKPADAGSPGD